MATVGGSNPTLADVAMRLDPDGTIAKIVEILNQTNSALDDMVFVEGNLPNGHKTTIRAGIPSSTWRKIYQGVPPTKSETVPVIDTVGNLEQYGVIDMDIVDLNGQTAEFLMSENKSHIEGMAQDAAETLVYGDTDVNPERFTGLAARYNDLSAQNARNIYDAGGTGSDNTSIWLVVWGEEYVHGIYPKGKNAGLKFENHGQRTVYDGSNNPFEAWQTHWKWELGLSVRDWRYAGRICNIDVSDLNTIANTANLVTWMTILSERIESLEVGRPAWYVNRTIREKLRLGILEKISNNLTWETVAGRRVMMFDGVQVKRLDRILNSESQVT